MKSPAHGLSEIEFSTFARIASGATSYPIALDSKLFSSSVTSQLLRARQKLVVAYQSDWPLISRRHGLLDADARWPSRINVVAVAERLGRKTDVHRGVCFFLSPMLEVNRNELN